MQQNVDAHQAFEKQLCCAANNMENV